MAYSTCCIPDTCDTSIRRARSATYNNGPTRPVHPELERAEILLSLRDVDGVVLFDDDTPIAVIDRIQPDVLVKGADWGHDAIVGRDIVEARGGRVVRIPLADGFSSTQLIRRAAAARR
jgi:rfaE bifunctional protein nucleotidyltransferase chain/domain